MLVPWSMFYWGFTVDEKLMFHFLHCFLIFRRTKRKWDVSCSSFGILLISANSSWFTACWRMLVFGGNCDNSMLADSHDVYTFFHWHQHEKERKKKSWCSSYHRFMILHLSQNSLFFSCIFFFSKFNFSFVPATEVINLKASDYLCSALFNLR